MKEVALYLASASPRRRSLLIEHGFDPIVISSGIDDGPLVAGVVAPECWTIALAYMKARAGLESLERSGGPCDHAALVLGADTVVVKDTEIIGQPRDVAHARSILFKLHRGSHRVISGVALLIEGERHVFSDSADVSVGALSEEQVDSYLSSGSWLGKAGAYNLSERIEAGWPIEYRGDPATVMGLPMNRLASILNQRLATETRFSQEGA